MTIFIRDTAFYDRQANFRGCARIMLQYLLFEDDRETGVQTENEKNVSRLVKIFELEGC
jgi:hypothetical protein